MGELLETYNVTDLHRMCSMLDEVVRGQAQLQDAIAGVRSDVQTILHGGVHFNQNGLGRPRGDTRENCTPASLTCTRLESGGLEEGMNRTETIIATQHKRRLSRFKRTFERAETLRDQERRNSFREPGCPGACKDFYKFVRAHQKTFFDVVSALVIFLNAACVSLSMDAKNENEENWYQRVDMCFTIIFVLELVVKLRVYGSSDYFCGADRLSNLFDTALIIADCVQSAMTLAGSDAGVVSASLFRLVRLVRLTRLVRILRAPIFTDFRAMVSGMRRGVITLVWAAMTVFLVIWLAALMLRIFLPLHQMGNNARYFDTVGRSVFSVFRCSFGDCSTEGGTSLVEHIVSAADGPFSFLWPIGYCMYSLFVTVGVFNIISAIFVDSIVTSEAGEQQKKMVRRLEDKDLWSKHAMTFVRGVLQHPDSGFVLDLGVKMSDIAGEIADVNVDRHIIEEVIRSDEGVADALVALDIDIADHFKVDNILDHDRTGKVNVMEALNGLQRLRGTSRRSDIISVELVLQGMQEQLTKLLGLMDPQELLMRSSQLSPQNATIDGNAIVSLPAENNNVHTEALSFEI